MNALAVHTSHMRSWRGGGTYAALILLLVGLSGCTTAIDRSVALSTEPVTAISVGEATAVSAYDLAEAMLRAGFTREDILRYGPAIHDALATSGGAQVREGQIVSALFAVHSDQLYVTSRTRGTFVQPLGGGLRSRGPAISSAPKIVRELAESLPRIY